MPKSSQISMQFILKEPDQDLTSKSLIVGLLETLECSYLEGGYVQVISLEPDAFPGWVGIGESRNEAILEYLKKRLGIGLDEDTEES